MAYVNKEVMQKAKEAVKKLCKEYNMKVSLAGLHTSTLRATIQAGEIDLISNAHDCAMQSPRYDNDTWMNFIIKNGHLDINRYYIHQNYSGRALEFIEKLHDILKADHWDESDAMTDYFSCAFYINMQVGKWNKPYQLLPLKK